MSSLTSLEFLMTLERVLGVFRLHTDGRRLKLYLCVASAHIISVLYFLYFKLFVLPRSSVRIQLFHILVNIFALFSITLARINTRKFAKLFSLIKEVNYLLNCNGTSRVSRWLAARCVLWLATFITYNTLAYYGKEFTFVRTLLFSINALCDLRFALEYESALGIIDIIAGQLKTLRISLLNESNKNTASHRLDTEEFMSIDKYKRRSPFAEAYLKINECCDLFHAIYGFQVSFSIATLFCFTLDSFYFFSSSKIKLRFDRILLFYLLSIIPGNVLFLMSCVKGQRVCNEWQRIKTYLADGAVSSCDTDEVGPNAPYGCLRLVRARPVRVRVLGGVRVRLALAPAVVSQFAVYFIFLLQYQNIV